MIQKCYIPEYLFDKCFPIWIIFLLVFTLFSPEIFPQKKTIKDTLPQKDSTKIYKDIKRIAEKRKLTWLLYRSLFREINAGEKSEKKVQKQKQAPASYRKYQGKIIRNIKIIAIDPFGDLQDDTIVIPQNLLQKAGNKLHVTTHKNVIHNQLLFKEDEPLDSLKLIESERILRRPAYIQEAKVWPQPIANQNDSLDVLVIVRDRWSIEGIVDINPSRANVQLSDANFMGFAHQISNTVSWSFVDRTKSSLEGNYSIANIHHTFITGTAVYNTSVLNKGLGFSLDRGFFSPLTKWAGGMGILANRTEWPFTYPDKTLQYFPAVYYSEDIWLGRSFSMKKKFNAYKQPKLLLTGRVYNMRYSRRPSFLYDSLKNNSNNTFYLFSIGYSMRSYYKDKNIYQFGKTEDVPEGKFIALIGGMQKKEFTLPQAYYGIKLSFGKHIEDIGYLAGNFEHGSFLKNQSETRGVINGSLFFFNDLYRFRNWSIRQFVDYHFTFGVNREPGESIEIDGSNGLSGFSGSTLKGKNKMALNLASVIYTPYRALGFGFAAFLFTSFANISETQSLLLKSKIYQAYGIGLLIRNEFLAINTIQISFGFYPEIPGDGKNVFKVNPIRSSAFGFNDLYFSKPDFIGYF